MLPHMSTMRVRETPAVDWDERVGSAWLSTGFAAASAATGHRVLYAEDDADMALVLLRSVPIPLLHRWTLRAKIFLARRDGAFLRRLVDVLSDAGVTQVHIGHHCHPWRGAWPVPWRGFQSERLGTAIIDDVQKRPADFLAVRRTFRQNLAKAERAHVEVAEVVTAEQFDAFCTLIDETDRRMMRHGVCHIYPRVFFNAARRYMVPRGQAIMLLAHAGGTPLAAQLYFVSGDHLTYYHGGSTRDRELTPKQGPTAAIWRAIAIARERGHHLLNLGGVSPEDSRQAGVTQAKRQLGTRFVDAEVAHVRLAPVKVRVQERFLLPAWKYAHPLYVRLFGRSA